jgi:hypothetical protein
MASIEPTSSTAEVLGDALIPVINKLQDIFSQVRRCRTCTWPPRRGHPGKPLAHAAAAPPPRR